MKRYFELIKKYPESQPLGTIFEKASKFIGKEYCYIKWVPQMAERETALVVWAKKKVSRSTGSVGCAESQRQDKIRTVEFSEFFL